MVNIKFVHLVFLSLLPAFVKKPAVHGEKNFGSIYQKLGKMCYDDPKNYIEKKYEQGLYCDVEFTGTCWPQVRAGFTVLRHCPRLYFKDEALISRHCSKSGVWGIANFTSCVKLTAKEAKEVILKIAKEIHLTVDKNPVQRVENVKQHEDYERKIHVYLICSWITETALFLTLIVMSFQ
ncbi:hypothetical protein AC249_AIPGENE6167 [Exaiptasia diaphana]|nr:hypothetical protein AC249_AIPGENE6167 [Exaiptasia diaphana]